MIKTCTPCLKTTSFKDYLVNFSIESFSFIGWIEYFSLCNSCIINVLKSPRQDFSNFFSSKNNDDRREHVTEDEKLDNVDMGKYLEIGCLKSSSFKVEETNKKGIDNSNSKKVSDELDIGMQIGCENGTPRTEAIEATNISNAHVEDLKMWRKLKPMRKSEMVYAIMAFLPSQRNVDNCSPLGIYSKATKADIIQSNSNGTPVQGSNGSDDMGSTTNNAFTTKPDDKPLPNNSTVVQVYHHYHHYHHHYHHVHKHQQQQKMVDPDDRSLRNIESNILTGLAEGNAANYGSGSGSNNKSNGENGSSWQNGSSSVQVVKGGKIESDNGLAKNDNSVPKKDNGVVIKCNDEDGSGSGSGRGSGVDQERLSQRAAALNKFYQKRKESCFEKKCIKTDYSMIAPLSQLKSDQNTTAFEEVAIIHHPHTREYAFGFITSLVVLLTVGNKMHKAFPLLVRKFPLPEGTSHSLKKNATARRKVLPLPEICTAINVKEKPVLTTLEDPDLSFQLVQDMDQQYSTVAKIPMLDTGKFEQWQFRMQQYLQHEHYALWEVIEFRDSYMAPESIPSTTSSDKSGRTITLTTEDMQKKKNDVKARTTLLLSLPDEHQLRFSKHKTAKELWAVILKTFGGNEATKKTKKNLLKQQYRNFRAEGAKTLEQTFTRLQVIVGQLQFMGIEVKQDDLNQKFLTSLAPEWLMHTIVWRNRSDLDTMSLDDLYNHLKVYEAEVQKKSEPNTQNMAFISSTKHRKGNDEVNTASGNVLTASANVATVSISQETACAYIASQSELPETRREEGDTYRQGSKAEEQTPKALMTEVVDGKLAGLRSASKDLDNLIESQRSDKSKEGLGYTAVPPPVAQLYLSPKKDLS
nr:hypothetical protein [Tanacetum cinerariifolium]